MAITVEELAGDVSKGLAAALEAALSQQSETSVQMVVINLPLRAKTSTEVSAEPKEDRRKPGRPPGAKDRDPGASAARRSGSQTARMADPVERARIRATHLQLAAQKAQEELRQMEGQ